MVEIFLNWIQESKDRFGKTELIHTQELNLAINQVMAYDELHAIIVYNYNFPGL